MSQSMTVYGQIPNVSSLIETMGAAIFGSGMMGCKNKQQGQVMAMACLHQQTDPMTLGQRFHILHGRLTMRADAMLAEFHIGGGKSKVIERSPERAAVKLTNKYGETTEFSFSWDEASKEPFVYEGKEADVIAKLAAGKDVKLKSKYATPRSRMQMLWARVVSDGVRTIAPEVNLGTYSPEEVSDFESSPSDAVTVSSGTMPPNLPPSQVTSPAGDNDDDAEDAEYESATNDSSVKTNQIGKEAADEIRVLVRKTGQSKDARALAEIEKVKKKLGVANTTLEELTETESAVLIDGLQKLDVSEFYTMVLTKTHTHGTNSPGE